jgi:hypothetical protein
MWRMPCGVYPEDFSCLPREQFEAADMDAGQHDDRSAGIDLRDISAGEEIGKIDLAAQKRVYLLAARGLDIPDVGEALRSQQLLGHIFGRDADAAVVHQSHGRRFERLRRCRPADEAGGARH